MNSEFIAEAREAFELFDKKNDGVLDVEELMLVFGSFGIDVTKKQLE